VGTAGRSEACTACPLAPPAGRPQAAAEPGAQQPVAVGAAAAGVPDAAEEVAAVPDGAAAAVPDAQRAVAVAVLDARPEEAAVPDAQRVAAAVPDARPEAAAVPAVQRVVAVAESNAQQAAVAVPGALRLVAVLDGRPREAAAVPAARPVLQPDSGLAPLWSAVLRQEPATLSPHRAATPILVWCRPPEPMALQVSPTVRRVATALRRQAQPPASPAKAEAAARWLPAMPTLACRGHSAWPASQPGAPLAQFLRRQPAAPREVPARLEQAAAAGRSRPARFGPAVWSPHWERARSSPAPEPPASRPSRHSVRAPRRLQEAATRGRLPAVCRAWE
jgi:hypothetical protein